MNTVSTRPHTRTVQQILYSHPHEHEIYIPWLQVKFSSPSPQQRLTCLHPNYLPHTRPTPFSLFSGCKGTVAPLASYSRWTQLFVCWAAPEGVLRQNGGSIDRALWNVSADEWVQAAVKGIGGRELERGSTPISVDGRDAFVDGLRPHRTIQNTACSKQVFSPPDPSRIPLKATSRRSSSKNKLCVQLLL